MNKHNVTKLKRAFRIKNTNEKIKIMKLLTNRSKLLCSLLPGSHQFYYINFVVFRIMYVAFVRPLLCSGYSTVYDERGTHRNLKQINEKKKNLISHKLAYLSYGWRRGKTAEEETSVKKNIHSCI